jgi:hypothetical protein
MWMYQVKMSNRFAVLENLNENEDISRAWARITENIKTLAAESPG